MKTAVTVLQEMMVKMGQTPEYECIAQSGPQHQAMFDYRCMACGVVVTATARSKKEAKQEVARLMLQQLSRRGHAVPPPYAAPAAPLIQDTIPGGTSGSCDVRSYVALLKELCEEYRLPAVTYELVGDTGPPHLRHFTMRARIGQHERVATSTTKKAARQLAAEELYSYLREHLARVTRDFNEEDALVRAHEKAMERYVEGEEHLRRPDLGLRIADYHLALVARLDEDTRAQALAALEAARELPPEGALDAVAAALRLRLDAAVLPPLSAVQLSGAGPDLAFAGATPQAAAADALDYLRRALQLNTPVPVDLPNHPGIDEIMRPVLTDLIDDDMIM
ncbi:unnamed protein product [Spodoptera littoralis]|uniref:DRBM domain-containing protein n=1 Tax=Spodoptera littoralis TaxID=7109 RepID=A0A9P0MYW3_SPOLI|nr:unnamed protein product [Spodoptera littoralis]CAH1635433.1 unnamed protein product [Spodoptera littoralis]